MKNLKKQIYKYRYYTSYRDKIFTDSVNQWKANAKSGVNTINLDRNVINNLSEEQKIADIQKATGNKVTVYSNGNDTVYGYYDKNGDQIYINAASGAVIDTKTFVNTYGHETGHAYTKNYNNKDKSEAIANNSGNYAEGIYALSNMLTGDSINTGGTATNNSWLYNQLSNKTSANMLIGNTISANMVNEGDRDNSTIVRMSSDKKTGTVLSAKKDGDRNIYDEKGNKVGVAYSDAEFLNKTCESGNCKIHFNVSVDFKGLAKDIRKSGGFWTTKDNMKTKQAYDLKNTMMRLGYTESMMDGIVNANTGIIMNGDSVGNYNYGAVTGEMGLPYSIAVDKANKYHNKSNNVNTGETPQALRAIKDGYNLTDRSIFRSLGNFDYFNSNNNKNKALNNVRNNIKKNNE